MTRQNASAFCHPEGVFTPLPSAKNVKTTVRIQFIYVSAPPTAFLITWILRYTQNDTKRGCVLCVIIGGVARSDGEWRKIDSCKNCKGTRTLHWPPILPVARKPRFFCNTFFHKNEKIFWRISAIFQFLILPKSRCKKTLVFL